MNRPRQRRLNQIAGVLFILAAVVWFVRDEVANASAYVAIGVLFLILSQNDS